MKKQEEIRALLRKTPLAMGHVFFVGVGLLGQGEQGKSSCFALQVEKPSILL